MERWVGSSINVYVSKRLELTPLTVSLSLSPVPEGIDPEDLLDEEEVIQTQPSADYHSIDSDKQPIPLSS